MPKTADPLTLTELGLALLLAMGDAALRPPKPSRGIPGIRCEYQCGQLQVTAEGYPCRTSSRAALLRALRVCEDAGLVIVTTSEDAFCVRRHPTQ